ncbi:hypothetical protein [Arthrobacter sp. 92]
MRKYKRGVNGLDSRRELRRRRLQVLTRIGLAVLALATAVVVVIALQR